VGWKKENAKFKVVNYRKKFILYVQGDSRIENLALAVD
jgi:hypothetical protein